MMKKVYPYQRRKQQVNINMSKIVLKDMDKERLFIDMDSLFIENEETRSQFIQRAVINYIMERRKLREINSKKRLGIGK